MAATGTRNRPQGAAPAAKKGGKGKGTAEKTRGAATQTRARRPSRAAAPTAAAPAAAAEDPEVQGAAITESVDQLDSSPAEPIPPAEPESLSAEAADAAPAPATAATPRARPSRTTSAAKAKGKGKGKTKKAAAKKPAAKQATTTTRRSGKSAATATAEPNTEAATAAAVTVDNSAGPETQAPQTAEPDPKVEEPATGSEAAAPDAEITPAETETDADHTAEAPETPPPDATPNQTPDQTPDEREEAPESEPTDTQSEVDEQAKGAEDPSAEAPSAEAPSGEAPSWVTDTNAEDGAVSGTADQPAPAETAEETAAGIGPDWELRTTVTREMHTAAIDRLSDMLPDMIGRQQHRRLHHATAEERAHDNRILASLLDLETDLLTMRRAPSPDGSRILQQAGRIYPPEIGEAMADLVVVNDALFGHLMAEELTAIWFEHAVLPGGKANVALADMRKDWEDAWPALAREPGVGQEMRYELQVKLEPVAMPPRERMRFPDGRALAGFANVTYRPERGYAAVMSLARVKAEGKRIREAAKAV